MKTKRGSNRQAGAPALPGAGRPPKSITFRVGDAIALRYGHNTPLEVGEVTEMHRGIPRTVVIQLRNGETVWVLIETPVADT